MAADELACEICNDKFDTKWGRYFHVKTLHVDPKSFQCEICNFKTSQRKNLEMHIKRVHEKESKSELIKQSSVKNHGCKLCPSRFPTSHALGKHKKSVHVGITS